MAGAYRIWRLLAIAAVFSLLVACGGGDGTGTTSGGNVSCPGYTECAMEAGLPYAVYQPEGLEQGAPLLVVLHGASVGRQFTEQMWQARRFADQYHYLVAIPTAGTWNYTTDQQRVIDLIDRLQGDYSLSDQVFLAGWSNGSELSQFLACDHAERFTAVVSYAGPLDARHDCQPSQPVAVMMIHGTADQVVNINGGSFGTMSHQQGFALWRQLNQCSDDIASREIPLEAGRTSLVEAAQGCATAVQAVTSAGGQHQANWDANQLHPLLAEFFAAAGG